MPALLRLKRWKYIESVVPKSNMHYNEYVTWVYKLKYISLAEKRSSLSGLNFTSIECFLLFLQKIIRKNFVMLPEIEIILVRHLGNLRVTRKDSFRNLYIVFHMNRALLLLPLLSFYIFIYFWILVNSI